MEIMHQEEDSEFLAFVPTYASRQSNEVIESDALAVSMALEDILSRVAIDQVVFSDDHRVKGRNLATHASKESRCRAKVCM